MVDGSNWNECVCLLVVQPPARVANVGTIFDVVYGADIWEAGEILEMREFLGEV